MEANEKDLKVSDFVANWKDGFIERIKTVSKSKKQDFTFVVTSVRFVPVISVS